MWVMISPGVEGVEAWVTAPIPVRVSGQEGMHAVENVMQCDSL